MGVRVIHDDCVAAMAKLAADGVLVDSVVTDPPYHLTSMSKPRPDLAGKDNQFARRQAQMPSTGFMGKEWDGGDVAFRPETWAAVMAVMKPGAHLIAFSGSRTYHRMACAIEDAGFEIRDQMQWVFGSGFPKSHNVGNGFGTALKPAHEPIVLARKPFKGTVAGNMLEHGVGGINIDGCRIGTSKAVPASAKVVGASLHTVSMPGYEGGTGFDPNVGRWPANVLHDGSDEVVAAFPVTAAGTDKSRHNGAFDSVAKGHEYPHTTHGHADAAGSAARFFYSSKADAADRCGSKHPTVKPTDLMAYLCRLVTPAGGTVLDPFAGSGSTGMACLREGFDAILIEREAEYVADIERRLAHVAGLDTALFGAAA